MCHKELAVYNCRHTELSVRSCSKPGTTTSVIKQRCLANLHISNPDSPIKIPHICFQCRREPFRFMDLPRELRDIVYTFCISDREAPKAYSWPRETSSTKILIRGKPWLNLLLGNRQIFREYRARVVKGVEVVLVDHFRTSMALDAPKLHPNLLRAPVNFRFLLLAPCEKCEKGFPHGHCYVQDEFNCQKRWLAAFTEQLVKPKSVNVRFDVWWPPKEGKGELQWPATTHVAFRLEESVNEVLQVPKLTELGIFRNRGTVVQLDEGINGEETEMKSQDLVARWTAEEKWQIPEQQDEGESEEKEPTSTPQKSAT